jgi:pimeloyl-ACP methyl ester carboxylesterase
MPSQTEKESLSCCSRHVSSSAGGEHHPTPGGPPLVLINGLAEQAESWYCNLDAWRRHFDVYTPHLLAYEGAALHRRIEAGQTVDIDYLVERLHEYVDGFVQAPPYHMVANSLGGKVAVEFAARYPDQVARLVLPCPSPFGCPRCPRWGSAHAPPLPGPSPATPR